MDPLTELRGKTTVPIWPDAARVLGISLNSAFKAAADGSLPTLRFGKRLVVPVPRLLAMLGVVDREPAKAG